MNKDKLPQNPLSAVEPTQGAFNVQKLFRKALQLWYLYLLSLLICVSYAWFKVHYATPMYKVNAQVIVQDDKGSGSTAQAISGNGMDFSSLFGSKINLYNELAILKTTDLSRKVVDDQELYITYYDKGDIRTVELYEGSPFQVFYHPDNDTIRPLSLQVSFDSPVTNTLQVSVGGKTLKWHFYDTIHYNKASLYFVKKSPHFNPEAHYIVSIQNPNAVAGAIANNLSASMLATRSTILNLGYNTNIPKKGERVLGGIMQAYIDRSLGTKNNISDSTIQFINQRIALVGNDLNQIETTIQNFREQNNITDITAQSGQLLNSSTDYYQKLTEINVQLEVIRTMLNYIQSASNSNRPIPSLLTSDPTFSSLVSNYNAAQVERDKLLLTLKDDNPIVQNLNSQISGLKRDMITSLQSQEKALSISKNDLVAQNSRVNDLIQKIPSQQRQFLDYSREQDLKQSLFLYLLQKREEIAIAKASNTSNASVVSKPRASNIPYEPVTATAYTISILLGLLLPTGYIVISSMLNNKVQSREDITGATPVTILSEIGHAKKDGLLNLAEEGRSMLAEQFRIFRTNMDFALGGTKQPLVLITSTMSGEGKSFIAANLGQIYAISGKKVLLMELDLRKPKLSQSLNISNESGFSNFIVSDLPYQSFIKPVPTISQNLFIMPSGVVPPNPAELLLSPKTNELLTQLKEEYDMVIVDTAPIGAVADAQILASFATVSLYIVRQGYSVKNSMTLVNDLVLNNKINPLYLVMNDIKGGSSYRYGYGYGYGGYGYGYHEADDKKKKWWKKND